VQNRYTFFASGFLDENAERRAHVPYMCVGAAIAYVFVNNVNTMNLLTVTRFYVHGIRCGKLVNDITQENKAEEQTLLPHRAHLERNKLIFLMLFQKSVTGRVRMIQVLNLTVHSVCVCV
jgi:hypothetical protein